MVMSDGDTLLRSLREITADVGVLLSRLDEPRRRPTTSQERRRLADQAERTTAALDLVCRQLGAWIGEQHTAQREPEPAEPAEATETPDRAWARVTRAQEALDAARTELQRCVESARRDGATWRQIGAALGVAAQTAHKRFDPNARRRHAVYMREHNQRRSGSRHLDPEAGAAEG